MMRRLAASLVAALGVICGGCGSAPLSETQLHADAIRICAEAGRRTDRIPTPTSPAETKTFLTRGIATFTPELRELRKLRPPHEAAAVYAATVNAFANKLADLRTAMRDLAHREDPVIVLKTLQHRLEPLQAAENQGWEALELPTCVSR